IMCGLRFFYKTTLGMSGVSEHIPLGRRPDALPAVLARDEVERFLKAVSDLEFRTAFVTIYATGLRVVIHIRSGKGRKGRYVMRLAVGVHPDDIVVARQVTRRRKIPIGRSLRTAVSCNQVSATPLDGAYPVSPTVQGVAAALILAVTRIIRNGS